MCQYLENPWEYVQSYYLWLIGSCICAFDWYQDRWPWMTFNSISLNFQRIFRDFADFGRTNFKRMKIDKYCQRQRCKHVELEQFWHAFASRGFVSDSWAFLFLPISSQSELPVPFHNACSYCKSTKLVRERIGTQSIGGRGVRGMWNHAVAFPAAAVFGGQRGDHICIWGQEFRIT